MADELTVEGEQYISSKRASEITGYAQDYIGQLARKGLIDARRIGGLWYVSQNSLVDYKEKADAYKPEPPQRDLSRVHSELDSVISLDGADYISASRASEMTGYHQDYVGQLARTGKVLSRQIGNRWYVERSGVMAHKKEKDALLAAVQTQAVGLTLSRDLPKSTTNEESPFFTYTNDTRSLLPLAEKTDKEDPQDSEHVSHEEQQREEVHQVPIRILPNTAPSALSGGATMPISESRGLKSSSFTARAQVPLTIAVVGTVVLLASIGYVSVKKSDVLFAYARSDSTIALAGTVSSAFTRLGDALEGWLATEFVYIREE